MRTIERETTAHVLAFLASPLADNLGARFELASRVEALFRGQGPAVELLGAGGTCDGVEFEGSGPLRLDEGVAGRLWVLGGHQDGAVLPIKLETNAAEVVLEIGFGPNSSAKALKQWHSRRLLVWPEAYGQRVTLGQCLPSPTSADGSASGDF